MRSIVASSKGRAMTCRPTGSSLPPTLTKPAGTDMPGRPAMFTGSVNTSFRYIAIGSSTFSPIRNAVVGEVGETRTSKSANACS